MTVRAVIVLARRAVAFELDQYRSLFRWVSRRPDVPSDAVAFAYIGAVALLLWVFIAVSAIELVVLHLLLPWETIRVIADVLSLWGLAWMFGFMASFNVHPHLVSASGLRVRHGAGTDFTVGWEAIATIGVRERSREKSRAVQLDRDEKGTALNVVIASRTNVNLTLRHPLVVALPKGEESVTAVRLYADDARGLVSRVRGRPPSRDVVPHSENIDRT
jgi:hypothetical protein